MNTVDAIKAVSKLPQPEGMYKPTWRRLQRILRVMCKHLPDAYPSINRISYETRLPVSTVARLLTRAEELELIVRTPRTVPGKFDSYTYRLVFLDSFSVPNPGTDSVSLSVQVENKGIEKLRFSVDPSGLQIRSGVRLRAEGAHQEVLDNEFAYPPPRPNRYSGNCGVCGSAVYAFTGILHGKQPRHSACATGVPDRDKLRKYHMKHQEQHGNPDGWGPTFGDDPDEPLPVHHSTPAKPQARLARHFEDRWNDALSRHPAWRGLYRGIDLGPAIGYIKTKFLDAGYSEEHVRAMVNEFFEDLLDVSGDLTIKEGQSCWQLFTGWWGRNPVPDPRLEREREERYEFHHALARQQIEEVLERKSQSWERFYDGTMTDEDYRILGLPKPLRRS